MKLQKTSLEIWNKKYCLRDTDGKGIDQSPKDTLTRVCRALAKCEPNDEDKWFDEFVWAVENGAVPAGRILANAGAAHVKSGASLINCVVMPTIPDSMTGILDVARKAGNTLAAGCGIGICFSTIRPRGSYVNGVGAYTSGAVSFMDIYDSICFTISSAGGRRGAQMATMDVRHPDITEYIKAKRENGRLRQFNMSCLITDEFIEAVKTDGDWDLIFPVNINHRLDLKNKKYTHAKWHVDDINQYMQHDSLDGRILCEIYNTIKAKDLWNTIMKSTYDYAEPGFILIDKINDMNNLWFDEYIDKTNPCGEQPLPDNGSCLLGSVNLTQCIIAPFTINARFDFEKFSKVVKIFSRMLDNVVELNGLPLKEQVAEITNKRRHGMGYTGLGSALTMLCIPYGSPEAVAMTSSITKALAIASYEEGIALSKSKGCAPILSKHFTVTEEMLAVHPDLPRDRDVYGSELMGLYSKYLAKFPDIIRKGIGRYGCRYTHATSIAPTGTISLSMCNNVSNGIEPSFSHEYFRNVIQEGKKTKEQVAVTSYELLLYRDLVDPLATVDNLPDYFVTSDSIPPSQHVDMQSAAQEWIDSSISKCVAKGTLIMTNMGLLPIEELGYADTNPGFYAPLAGLKVLDRNGEWKKVTKHYKDENTTSKRLILSNGTVIHGSLNHKMLTAEGWCKLRNISVGDKILHRNVVRFGSDGNMDLQSVGYTENDKLPKRMTPEIAQLLGMLCSNGELTDTYLKFKHPSTLVRRQYSNILLSLGIYYSTYFDERDQSTSINVKSLYFVTWIRKLMTKHNNIHAVPDQILRGNIFEKETFISGMQVAGIGKYADDATIYTGPSKRLRDDVLSILTSLNYRVHASESTVDGRSFTVNVTASRGDSNDEYYELEVADINYGVTELYDIEVEDTHSYLINGAISHNTINVATDIPFDEFKDIYMYGYEKELRGLTTFRFNPDAFQGVLVTEDDLDSTVYEFTLKDGSKIKANGNDKIEYDGEVHVAANLFDSLKEGTYGKY